MEFVHHKYLKAGLLGLCTLLFAQGVIAQTSAVPPITILPVGEPQKGLSFGVSGVPDTMTGIIELHCAGNTNSNYKCNPYQGDMACSVKLPVLCFNDIAAPAPSQLKDTQYWSGGVVVTTPKVAASQFQTIKHVNDFCAAKFGKGWRAASFHDGGGEGIQAYGNVGDPKQRVWLDIKNQKDGTCWSR